MQGTQSLTPQFVGLGPAATPSIWHMIWSRASNLSTEGYPTKNTAHLAPSPLVASRVPWAGWGSGHNVTRHPSPRRIPTLYLHVASLNAASRQLGVVVE